MLAEHRALLRAAFAEHGGAEVDTQGDSFFVAFGRSRDAVEAAVAAQRALGEHAWPDRRPVLVRMRLHTGALYRAEHGSAGLAVHRAARICSIAHGGQVLLSRGTAGIVDDEEVPGVGLRDLGEHRLKDIDPPERIYQLVVDGLPSDFPPLRAMDEQLPLSGTVTVVVIEGRRMLRLHREVAPERFAALIRGYQGLLRGVLEALGGHEVDAFADTAMAAFPTAKQAAQAAVAAQQAVAAHAWPQGLTVAVSIGIHSGEAGIGWVGPAVVRCSDLCDVAEGGQIFMSQATASLLEEEDLGELSVRDVGKQQTRRTKRDVRAFELVFPDRPR